MDFFLWRRNIVIQAHKIYFFQSHTTFSVSYKKLQIFEKKDYEIGVWRDEVKGAYNGLASLVYSLFLHFQPRC